MPERRFIWAGALVVLLLLIMVALGLSYSITSRNKVCPPDNPDCAFCRRPRRRWSSPARRRQIDRRTLRQLAAPLMLHPRNWRISRPQP